MIKIIKMTLVLLLAAMTAAAILVLISEPKNIGSYAAIITVIFFDVVGYLAMYHKKNKIYIALHEANLGEENENY